MKVFVLAVFLVFNNLAMAKPYQIILIRHAEKPEKKSPDLSEKGFQRAKVLVQIFDRHPQLVSRGKPNFIFATKYIPGESARRTYQTVKPLSEEFNLSIDDSHLTENYRELAGDLLENPKYSHSSVFVSWTHSYIVELAKTLGSAPKDKWKSDVFDRIWVIRFDDQGKASSMDLPQRLLSGDSNN